MDGSEPRVSVVAATHDRERRLAMLLDSLRAQTIPRESFEVIIVDDASSDGTRELLAREAARGDLALHVIHRDRSGGPGPARNDGWRAARAPLIAFTDDDCVADPRWLESGLEAQGGEPKTVVQGWTEPMPSELHLQGPFSRTLRMDRLGPMYQTANMFYPRAVLEELGGFDATAFPMVGEDTDLAWRAIATGVATRLAPDALVFHAVTPLGPLGYLRTAGRWAECVQLVRRHPELRRAKLYKRFFWHGNHWLLFRVVVAVFLRRRLPLVMVSWLRSAYIVNLALRIQRRGGGPLIAPYLVLFDVIEMAAMLRASAKYRTLVI